MPDVFFTGSIIRPDKSQSAFPGTRKIQVSHLSSLISRYCDDAVCDQNENPQTALLNANLCLEVLGHALHSLGNEDSNKNETAGSDIALAKSTAEIQRTAHRIRRAPKVALKGKTPFIAYR